MGEYKGGTSDYKGRNDEEGSDFEGHGMGDYKGGPDYKGANDEDDADFEGHSIGGDYKGGPDYKGYKGDKG